SSTPSRALACFWAAVCAGADWAASNAAVETRAIFPSSRRLMRFLVPGMLLIVHPDARRAAGSPYGSRKRRPCDPTSPALAPRGVKYQYRKPFCAACAGRSEILLVSTDPTHSEHLRNR